MFMQTNYNFVVFSLHDLFIFIRAAIQKFQYNFFFFFENDPYININIHMYHFQKKKKMYSMLFYIWEKQIVLVCWVKNIPVGIHIWALHCNLYTFVCLCAPSLLAKTFKFSSAQLIYKSAWHLKKLLLPKNVSHKYLRRDIFGFSYY